MEHTHWKKLKNNNYIGAYMLEPGQEIILTITKIENNEVVGEGGEKSEGTLMYFKEVDKPMILNSTNAKAITSIYDSPYIEDWENTNSQTNKSNSPITQYDILPKSSFWVTFTVKENTSFEIVPNSKMEFYFCFINSKNLEEEIDLNFNCDEYFDRFNNLIKE